MTPPARAHRGRAIRFLMLVLCGWALLRAAILTVPSGPHGGRSHTLAARGHQPVGPIAPFADPAPRVLEMLAAGPPTGSRDRFRPVAPHRAARAPQRAVTVHKDHGSTPQFRQSAPIAQPAGRRWADVASPIAPAPAAVLPVVPPLAPAGPGWTDRWRGSAWAFWRPAAAPALSGAGALGGTQAGVRVAWHPWGDDRFATYARLVAAPSPATADAIAGGGRLLREAAIGVSLRPVARLPVAVIAERRSAAASPSAVRAGQAAGAANVLAVVGGIDRAPATLLGRRFSIDAYGQGGIAVRKNAVTGFAEGQLSVTTQVVTRSQGPALSVGAIVAAAVQDDGAESIGRIDVGPRFSVQLPGQASTVRINADWRVRVAGGATPGSGPAVGVAIDF